MCRFRSKINSIPRRASNNGMNAGQVVSSINNLIIGKIYVDHGGTMRIHSSASNLVCKLKFKEQGVLRMREAHEVGTLHSLCYCFAIVNVNVLVCDLMFIGCPCRLPPSWWLLCIRLCVFLCWESLFHLIKLNLFGGRCAAILSCLRVRRWRSRCSLANGMRPCMQTCLTGPRPSSGRNPSPLQTPPGAQLTG